MDVDVGFPAVVILGFSDQACGCVQDDALMVCCILSCSPRRHPLVAYHCVSVLVLAGWRRPGAEEQAKSG